MNREQKLEEALERVRVYVANAVADDGGIDECDIEYRADLEAVDAALSTPKAEAVERAASKFELWFFRDISDEQRLSLFRVFDYPINEIGRFHSHQRTVLRRLLAAFPSKGDEG